MEFDSPRLWGGRIADECEEDEEAEAKGGAQSRIIEARFIGVPGAGHLMQEDAPEAIVAALAEFPPLAFVPAR